MVGILGSNQLRSVLVKCSERAAEQAIRIGERVAMIVGTPSTLARLEGRRATAQNEPPANSGLPLGAKSSQPTSSVLREDVTISFSQADIHCPIADEMPRRPGLS
jgi:hypothetical protein